MTARRRFASADGSVGAARRFVAELIADAPSDVQDSVALMVSELATNALIHAATGFDIAVDRVDPALLVSVSDRGDGGMPQLQAPGSSEPHGRGLRVVDALSEEWGVTTTWDQGKTVWFRVSLASPESSSAGAGDPDAASVGQVDPGDPSSDSNSSIIGADESLSDASNARRRGVDPRFRSRNRGFAIRRRGARSSR